MSHIHTMCVKHWLATLKAFRVYLCHISNGATVAAHTWTLTLSTQLAMIILDLITRTLLHWPYDRNPPTPNHRRFRDDLLYFLMQPLDAAAREDIFQPKSSPVCLFITDSSLCAFHLGRGDNQRVFRRKVTVNDPQEKRERVEKVGMTFLKDCIWGIFSFFWAHWAWLCSVSSETPSGQMGWKVKSADRREGDGERGEKSEAGMKEGRDGWEDVDPFQAR